MRQREALFYAHLYLGLYFDALGEHGKMSEHIAKAAGEFSAEHYMGDVARVHQSFKR
jgi:lipoprotein NlpI